MSSTVSNTVSYGRPERKDVTERIERMKREQSERDQLRRQSPASRTPHQAPQHAQVNEPG